MNQNSPRRQGRELAFQALYAEICDSPIETEKLKELAVELNLSSNLDFSFCQLILEKYLDQKTDIDQTIEAHLKNWTMDRLSKIDLCLLRLGCSEMNLGTEDHPVTINETVELAKRYGGENSPSFLNGILDEIAKGG